MEKLLELVAKLAPTLAPGGGAADMVLGLVFKYGPTLLLDVVQAMEKNKMTVADVEQIFSNVKPYSAFGIPDTAPAAAQSTPATPATAAAIAIAPASSPFSP